MEQRRRSVGPLRGRPPYRPTDLSLGPTASSLLRGSSSLDGEVGSRSPVHNSRPSKGWLPSIYMRGGAPFQSSPSIQAIKLLSQDVVHLLLQRSQDQRSSGLSRSSRSQSLHGESGMSFTFSSCYSLRLYQMFIYSIQQFGSYAFVVYMILFVSYECLE